MPEIRRHALLVGIDDYPALRGSAQLSGAVNDVDQMARVLEHRFEFPAENLRLLRDAEATRAAVHAELDGLVERAGEGDVAVVHWSGHGSQVEDEDGDEPDALDETLVPSDARDAAENPGHIVDDELRRYLSELQRRGVFTTLILDCCHSGDAHRDAGRGRVRSLPPVVGGTRRTRGSRGRNAALGPRGRGAGAFFAACQSEQRAREWLVEAGSGTVCHGHFTWALLRALERSSTEATVREIFRHAESLLRVEGATQDPQIEGDRDRLIFGVAARPPSRFVHVEGFESGRVELAAGAAQGLVEDSVWEVHPASALRPEPSKRLAEVRVTEVGALRSWAEPAEGDAGSPHVEAGTRAFERFSAYGELRLRVALPDDSISPDGAAAGLSAIRRRIEISPFLCLAAEERRAAVRLAPASSPADAGAWEIFDVHTGAPLPVAAGRAAGLEALFERLERRARCRHALRLENRSPASLLQGAIELELYRRPRDGEGRWRPLEAGAMEFCEGDGLAFEISNRTREVLWIYVFDFGLTDRVAQIYPLPGGQVALDPESSFRLGRGVGEEMALGFPDDFPRGRAGSGFGHLKVFAANAPADFEQLETARPWAPNPDLRNSTPLAQLLTMNCPAPGLRGGDEDWTTATASFELHRC